MSSSSKCTNQPARRLAGSSARRDGRVERRSASTSSTKSVSGSCISSAVLAAVLPRPIAGRFHEAHAQSRLGKHPRRRNAGDPAADHRDVHGQRPGQGGKPRDVGVAVEPEWRAETQPWHAGAIVATRLLRVKRSRESDGSGEGRTLLIGRNMKQQIDTKPYWMDSAALPAFPQARTRRGRGRRGRRRRHHRADGGVPAGEGRPNRRGARPERSPFRATPATQART